MRYQLLLRMRDELDRGARDPELLYLGARYAASLAMKDDAERFLGPLETLLGGPTAPTLLLRQALEGAARDLPPATVVRARAPLEEMAVGAAAAYEGGDLPSARLALEDLLLADAGRADVLWNLLIVTSEQQDVPACERYWRRYAVLQLTRMLRREAGAREELVRFYTRAATTTDRIFAESSVKVQERPRTPGLLPRWLEAHAALARSKLAFDPALTLLSRFAEWSRVHFGLEREDDTHAQTVAALAHCAARIRWQPYVPRLTAALRGTDADFRPFRRTMQEACSLPLQFRLRELLDAENWPELARLFGDPDLGRSLTPMLRLFGVLALCRTGKEREAFAIALDVLPDMTAEDIASDSQAASLWQNAL